MTGCCRYHRRRSRSREDCQAVSDGDYPGEKRARSHSKSSRRRSSRRQATGSPNELKQSSERYGTHDHDSGDDYYDESRVRCSSYSREQPSTRKKEQDLACDRDSGRYHAGNGSRSQTRTHSSSWRQEVDSPIENEKAAEKSISNISDKCEEKSRSCAHDSEGYYPDSNRVQHGSHVSRRARTSSQKKYADSSYYDRKLEENYDSEDNEQYDGNHRSHDYSSNIGHDENGHRDKSRSSKGKRNNNLKMSYHDECGKSKQMYDFDDQDRYDGRCGSGGCDSSGDYEENRSPSSNQSRRERASSLEKETDSPFKKRKVEENHRGRMKDRSPHSLNQYKRRYKLRKLDLSDNKYFGGNKESGSSSERSCDGSVHDATTRAHSWSSSEDSDDLRQSRHHGKDRRDARKRNTNVKGKDRNSNAEGLRSKKVYRKKSSSRSLG